MPNKHLMVPEKGCHKNASVGLLKALYGAQFWSILANGGVITRYLPARCELQGEFGVALHFPPSRARVSAAVSFEKFRSRVKDYQKRSGPVRRIWKKDRCGCWEF